MNTAPIPAPRHAAALRWLGRKLCAAADRIERAAKVRVPLPEEPYFDSDAYIAEIRNSVSLRYY